MSWPPHNLRRQPSFHRAFRQPPVSMKDAADPKTAVRRVAVANRQYLHLWPHRNSHRQPLRHSLSINAAGHPSTVAEVSSSAHNRSRRRRVPHRHPWHFHNSRHRHRLHSLTNNAAGHPSSVAGESNSVLNLSRLRKMQHRLRLHLRSLRRRHQPHSLRNSAAGLLSNVAAVSSHVDSR